MMFRGGVMVRGAGGARRLGGRALTRILPFEPMHLNDSIAACNYLVNTSLTRYVSFLHTFNICQYTVHRAV